MGATFVKETVQADTELAAYLAFLAGFGEYDDGHWEDPAAKPGYLPAWGNPVPECAVDWMVGWCYKHPPAGVKPQDKWGPWLVFPLEAGGWHFFGWVNT